MLRREDGNYERRCDRKARRAATRAARGKGAVRWDGQLRSFDDPARKPGEPWVMRVSPEMRARLDAELAEARGESFARSAVACQAVARVAMAERNERIKEAVAAGANVRELAAQLGLTRQQVHAIAKGDG